MIESGQIETLSKPSSLIDFINWEPNDGYKYEWNDGQIIKFHGMQKEQVYIYSILLELFIKNKLNHHGTLIAEQDIKLSGIQLRRPDICYITKSQIEDMRNGQESIPEFLIEIISANDNINQLRQKVSEYLKAGVKVIWLIYPLDQTIEVHHYLDKKNVKIYSEDEEVSASPVLDDFKIKVSAVFVNSIV